MPGSQFKMNNKMHKVLEWGGARESIQKVMAFVKVVRTAEILTRLSAGTIRRREAQISGVWKKTEN